MANFIQYFYRRYSRLLNSTFSLIESEGEKMKPMDIGRLGEDIAVVWLKSRGRKILYRNFRGPKGGEIDIIARDGNVLTFVEVKTRTSREFGRPLDAVDKTKQLLIERGANAWLKLLKSRDFRWRFDVVEIVLEEGKLPDVNLVCNAF